VVGEGRKEERLKVVVVTTILIDIEFAGVSDAAVVITGICMKPARVVRRARACLYFIGVILLHFARSLSIPFGVDFDRRSAMVQSLKCRQMFVPRPLWSCKIGHLHQHDHAFARADSFQVQVDVYGKGVNQRQSVKIQHL
jgi:hypothetical protein